MALWEEVIKARWVSWFAAQIRHQKLYKLNLAQHARNFYIRAVEFLKAAISFIFSFWGSTSLIVDLIPLIENSLSIAAILSSFFYFLYTLQKKTSLNLPLKKLENSIGMSIETCLVLISARKKTSIWN